MHYHHLLAIEKIISELKATNPDFPFMCCRITSWKIHEELGLHYVKGCYSGIMGSEFQREAKKYWQGHFADFTEVPHSFCYDPFAKLYIDATAGQFHNSNPPILIFNESDPRITIGSQNQTHHILTMFTTKQRGNIKNTHRAAQDHHNQQRAYQ